MKRLLIVEDDSVLRSSFAATLCDEYVVHAVSNGCEAVEFLRDHSVDVILLDMKMDEGDGFFVLGQVGYLAPTARVLVVSGVADLRKVTKAMRLGADNYLVKPVSLHAVRESLRQLVPVQMREGYGRRSRELLALAAC